MFQSMTPEVWITGASAVTSLGVDLKSTWKNILAGCTAGRWIELHTTKGQSLRLPAAPVQDISSLVTVPLEASCVRSDLLTQEVVQQAIASARLDEICMQRTAVIFGSSKPAMEEQVVERLLRRSLVPQACENSVACLPDDSGLPAWEFLVPQRGSVMARSLLKSQGPVLSAVSACSSGLHAIIMAAQFLTEQSRFPLALAGGVESCLNPLFAGSFQRMGVLAVDEPDPSRACRPFDVHRSGFILGEGAGALILETADYARSRGASPIAIFAGYARGTDPTGLAEMDPKGRPLASTIRRCLDMAGIGPERIACIKAHGTATQQNDLSECAAISQIFGDHCPPVLSLKGYLGHCLGASGAIEAAICTQALTTHVLPTSANLTSLDPRCTANISRQVVTVFNGPADHMLCLSAGFGGHLAAILLCMPDTLFR